MIKLLLVFFCVTSAFAVDRSPDSRTGFEHGMEFRLLKKYKRFIFLGETKYRKEVLGNDYQQVLAGSYYRITKRLRTGLFFQSEQGQRFDEDWRSKGGKWRWQNINGRWDFSSVADVTYNDKLSSHLVWEMKSRLYYYHSRDIVQLRLRPGLRYFHLKFGRPLWQAFLENEVYLPLNYGDRSIYEYWLYLGTLYQVNNRFGIGPVISFRHRKFNAYESFSDRTGEKYTRQLNTTYLGLNAVYSW